MAASPMKLGPGGELRRPGSSSEARELPSLGGQPAGRQFYPPPGVPRPPFNTAYPPPRPDFDAFSDDELPREPEPEPESFPGGVMKEESAPPAKPTMERKGKVKAAARPRSPEFKVHREEVEEILEKPRYTSGWYRKAARITEEKIKTGYGVTAEQQGDGEGQRDEDGDTKLPGERPVSPEAHETWSLVYQEPHAMMEDLHGFGDLNAADRAGWTALHWAALLGKEGHVRLLLDSEASIRARSRVSVGRDVRAPNEAQVAVRIPKGATPLDVVAAAIEGIASTKAGAKTVGTGVLTSAPLATGHSLIHAWLRSAESELVRQEETAKWEARVAEQAQQLTQNERERREAETAERYEAAQQAVADARESVEEGDPDRALKYALSAVSALAGDDKGAAEVVTAVREQLVVVVRRLTSAAKAAGRAEQAAETEEQTELSVEQTEKAEQLIRELRQQNEKGEAYFEREKAALQGQIEAMAERIGQSKQKLAAMEKLVAQRDEEVKNAGQAVVDANRARDRAELDAERLRKKQERLRSFTDEQTLAATEAAAEKTRLAEELAKRTSTERKAEDNLRQAVTNAEKENHKLTDKLAQVLAEKENLNAELRMIADEVSDVKASWMADRSLIQTLQMQLGAQQQQAGGQQSEMTAMAVQHALEAQQAQAYVAMIEQQNQQQQAALIASQQVQQQLEQALYQQQLAMQHQTAGNNPSAAVAARPANWPPPTGSFNPHAQPPMPWQQGPGQHPQYSGSLSGGGQHEQQQQQASLCLCLCRCRCR